MGLFGARMKNSIVSWATGQEGFCKDCKHCRFDKSRRFSRTDFFCSLSRCKDITETTRMNCYEKPKVTEADLQQLFALGIWTNEGKRFIRQSILGKSMTYSDVDEFLTALPTKYPEYIAPKS